MSTLIDIGTSLLLGLIFAVLILILMLQENLDCRWKVYWNDDYFNDFLGCEEQSKSVPDYPEPEANIETLVRVPSQVSCYF